MFSFDNPDSGHEVPAADDGQMGAQMDPDGPSWRPADEMVRDDADPDYTRCQSNPSFNLPPTLTSTDCFSGTYVQTTTSWRI